MSNRLNLTLDVTKTELQNPLIKLRQGDGNWETLRVTVTSNGEPLDLQGWTVTFMGTTAGSHKIVDADAVMVEAPNGIFDYTPTKAWGMDIGEFKIAYFKFVNGDGTASSANFRVIVDEAVDMTEEEAQDYISVVDGVIADVKEHLETEFAEISSNASEAITVSSSAVASIETTASNATATITTAESNANARFDEIEADLEAGNYVHKSGDTMTGELQLGGKAGSGEAGTQIRPQGNIELAGSFPFIDFHGDNDTSDFTSRLEDDGAGLALHAVGTSGARLLPIYGDANHVLNFDTMAGGTPVQPGNLSVSAVVEFYTSSSASGTLPPKFTGYGTLIHYGISKSNATQLYFDTNDESFAIRYMNSGEWKSWHSVVDNKVAEKEVSPKAGGVKIKLRRTGTTVHASFFGTPSNTLGFDVTLAEYSASDLAGYIPLESTNNYGNGDIKGNALSVRLQGADTDTLTLKQRSSQSGDPEYVAAGAVWETADAWPS